MHPHVIFANEPPTPIEDSLPELAAILESAKSKAPELAKETFLNLEASKRLKQAKAAYHPKLNLITNLGYRNDFRQGGEDSTHVGLTYTAQLERPIFHWGAIESGVEKARIENANNLLDYKYNKRTIQSSIRANYLQLLLNNLALKNEVYHKEIIEAKSEDDEINFESGKLSELAFKEKQLQLKASLLRIEKIKQSQQRIVEQFKLYAGWEHINDSTIIEVPKHDLEQVEAWLRQELTVISGSKLWLGNNYMLKKMNNSILSHKEDIIQIKAQKRPLVNATASARQNQTNTSTRNNIDTVSLFAGIRIQWNIYDGFLSKNLLAEAQLKLRRMTLESQQLSERTRLQAMELLDQLIYAVQNLELEEAKFELERVKLDNSKSEAAIGRQTNKSLENKKLEYDQRFLALQQYRADLHIGIQNYKNLFYPLK